MIYEMLGRYPEATKTYQDLLNLNPSHEKALFSLGWVFIDEKRLMEAVPLFKKAIALKPNDVNSHYSLGIAYDKMGLSDEALIQYQKDLQIEGNHQGAYQKIALLKRKHEIKSTNTPETTNKDLIPNSDIILLP